MSDEAKANDTTLPEDADDEVSPIEVETEVVEEDAEIELTLEDQLAEALAQAAEYRDGWQRAVAEVSNVKKRAERDRLQAEAELKFRLAKNLVDVLDDLDLAEQNLPEELEGNAWADGMLGVQRKLMTALQEFGLEIIDPTGEEFDPNLHEAISSEPHNEIESGHVIAVMRKGYRVNDRVVRAALVRVAQ